MGRGFLSCSIVSSHVIRMDSGQAADLVPRSCCRSLTARLQALNADPFGCVYVERSKFRVVEDATWRGKGSCSAAEWTARSDL